MAKNRIGFGSDIVLNNNNVGLGTTNPTEKLHVIGNIKATGTVSAASDLVVTKGKAIKFSNPVNEQTVDVLSDASLYVTGISTFSEGPLIIGSGTSTGTSTQRLQVTGGAYVSDNIGIGITKPTYKLDILGTQDPNKWVRQYFEGTYAESQLEDISRDEYISATAVDSLGNVYVSGGSWGAISPYEQKAYLLKLSPSGDLIWQLDFTNVDPSQDSLVADALHIDSSDNIYLGINVEDSIDAIVLKLNTSGSILWQRYLNIQFLSSIITDSSGAVYVGGSRNNLLGWIGKLSASTGLIEWQREINTGSGTTRGFGLLGVDSANNVYWSGSYITNSYYNGYIVKINSFGTVQWQKSLGGTVSRAAERITHIKVDSADNVYLLVTFETHSSVFPFTESYFIGLIKLNTSGTEIWQKQIGIDSDKAKSYSLSFDSTNNIYLVGEHFSQQNTNILIVKLDSSANIIWQKSFGIDGVEYSEGGWWNNGHTNIVVNNSNLIVSGYTNYVHQYDWALNAIIAKFTIDGNFNGNYGDFVVRDSNLSIGSTSRPISDSSFSISTSSATETAAGLGTTVATRTFKIEDVPTLNATGGRSFLEKLKSTDVNVSGEFVLNGIPFTNTESSDHNVAIGVGAGSSLLGGYNNFFVGKDAGRLTVNGCYNNFFGMCAGRSNVDGSYNNFFGKYAGYCLVSSGYNNFFGPAAGKYTTTGWSNNFIGYYSGWGNTTGSYNTFFGFVSGYCNTTGSYNNFFGCESGYNNTTGSYNNFYGNGPGFYNTTGCYNNFFGNQAGLLNTSGCGNNYFGGESGKCNTTGSYNNSYGTSSGYCNITGSLNNYFGSFSGISTAASFKVIIGSANALQYPFDAPNPNKDVQFAIGVRTDSNPSSYWITGDENMNLVFYNSIIFNNDNIKIGYYAGGNAAGGGNNVFIGYGAGYNNSGAYDNNFIGQGAGYYNTTGQFNSFFGESSGNSNTIGCCNSFFGRMSGCCNTIGSINSFFGTRAGSDNRTGNYNVFLGAYSGISTASSNKVIIGVGTVVAGVTRYLFDSPDTTKNTQFAIGVRTDANPSKYWLVGDENFNIGIGTTNPTSKLYVLGDITATGKITAPTGIEVSQGRKIKFGTIEVISDRELLLSGIATFTNGPVLIGSGTSTGTSTQRLQVTGGAYVSDNLGIGTTNPRTKLQVGGIIGFNDTNVRIGGTDTGASITSGCYNNFIGPGAGRSTTNGLNNNFFGRAAGYSSINASDNNFFGFFAGYRSINSFANNFLGYEAGYYTTSGDYNNFLGYQAGYNSTSARGNNFFGRQAGYNNTTGCYNVFFNAYAGYCNTTGRFNTFIGYRSGCSNTTASYNNFLGWDAGSNNTTGYYNNFFGSWAGAFNTVGYCNMFFGDSSGYCNTIGHNNTFLGAYSGLSTSASYRVIYGSGASTTNLFDAPEIDKDYQFAVGVRTDANPSKYWLVGNENFNIGIGTTNPKVKLQINGALGFEVYDRTTIGSQTNPDLFVGTNILIGDNTTGPNLTFGSQDFQGMNNIFIGVGAGSSATTTYANHFVGKYAGRYTTTGNANNFFGLASGRNNTTGVSNNFFGLSSGRNNTTGSYNAFLGGDSGYENTLGCSNAFFGASAGSYNNIGNYNSFFGNAAGLYNQSGSFNTFLGSYAGLSTSASYKVVIGSGESWGNNFDSPNPDKDAQLAIGIKTDANPSKYWLVGDENFNVGIGTTNPTSKLYVSGGAYISDNLGIGTTSPSYRLDILGTQDPNKWVRQYFEGTYESSQIEYSLNELVGATAVDSLGNIYVSGAANNNSGPGDNAYLLKLSPSGDLIWQLDFTTAADPYVYGDVLHIDSSDNIYLGINLVNAIDAAVLKLNTSGEIIWQRIIDIQFLSSVITDSFGDVYVSGSRNNFNGWLGKLSPSDGSIVWQRDTTTGSVTTRGYGIVGIDTSNNLYISGSYISGSWFDAYIQKYDSSGTIQWQKVLNGINSRSDYALQMGVDSSNNVYFLGYTTNTSNQTNIILVKFDTSGNVIWQKYIGDYSDDVSAYSLSFDSSNNIYIFGANNKDVPTESDILLFKLNSSGDSIWQKRFGGEGYPKYQELAWIYVNSGHKHIIVNGQDLIVSAQSSNMYYGYQNQLNVLIAKFSTDGNFNGKYGDFVVEDVNLGIGSTSYTIITSSFTVSTGIQTSSAAGFTTSVTVRTLKEEESTILNSIGGRSFLEIINSERINVNGEFVLNGIPFTQTNIVTNTQSGTSHNVAIGVGAGSSLSAGFGYNNFFVGLGAGKSTVGGGSNVFLGKYAGCSNIDGWANNFIGSCAGLCNQDGVSNNFFGYDAGYYNTTGDRNNFFGERAGYYNTTGNYNNFFGWDSGCDNTTGSYNNFFGTSSGRNNTTGSGNNFFGRYAGTTNTTGCGNNFFGRYAGNLNNSGSNNNFFGRDAGFSNTTGSCNNFIGFEAGDLNQTGNFNVVIGSLRNTPIRNGSNQLVIGAGSTDWIVGTSSYNVGIGTTTPTSKLTVVGDITATGRIISTSGVEVSQGKKIKFGAVEVISDAELLISGISTFTNGPVLIGSGTSTGTSTQRLQVTGGAYVSGNLGIGTTNPTTALTISGVVGFTTSNVRIGDNTTGNSTITGSNNVFIGRYAGTAVTTGRNNNFFGGCAGRHHTSGTYNNFFGLKAGYCNTIGSNNNFFGLESGYSNVNGYSNNFFGIQAGFSNTNGVYNNFFGAFAGIDNTTGYHNNFIGWSAGDFNTTGIENTFIGYLAGRCNTTGSHNNFFGTTAGAGHTTGCYNNFIGYSAGGTAKGGCNNNFFGTNNGCSNTTGSNNNFFGTNAGNGNTTGSCNNFIGYRAGIGITSGICNNYVGNDSGSNGSYNNALGTGTGGGGCYNNFIGNYTGTFNTTGCYNNFFGYIAGDFNTTGVYNNFFGSFAGIDNTTGSYNNFFGKFAGDYNSTGSYNTFLGNYTGLSTSSSYKVIVGTGYNSLSIFDSPDTTKDTQFAVGIRTDANPANYWLVGNENFNVGIGTTNPTSKLTVEGNALISGFITATTFIGQVDAGVGTITTLNSTSATITNLSGTNISYSGVSTFIDGPVFIGSGSSTAPSQPLQVIGDTYISGNLGIGTTNPTSKLSVEGGDIRVGVNTSHGVILTSPNGTQYRLIVDDSGVLSTAPV